MATRYGHIELKRLEQKGWRLADHDEILSVCPDYYTDFYCGDPFVVDPITKEVVSLYTGRETQDKRDVNKSLIVRYTELLNAYKDSNALPVKEFREKHGEVDPVFLERAKTLDGMMVLKKR